MNTSRRRKFTDDEKRQIVNDALLRGINLVLQENRLSYSVFSRWKAKFNDTTKAEKRDDRKIIHRLNEMIIENDRLKKIIANLMLDLELAKDRSLLDHGMQQ